MSKQGKWAMVKDAAEKRIYTSWMNAILIQHGQEPIDDLFVDLQNGVKLGELMLILSKQKDFGLNKKLHTTPKNILQSKENLMLVMDFIQNKEKVKLTGISTNDIANGNQNLILALMKSLIMKYQIESSGSQEDKKQSKSDLKKSVLSYLQNEGEKRNIKVDSIKKCCQSGLLLYSIIDNLNPGCIDFDQLDTSNPKSLNEEAIELAHQLFKIPKIVNSEDITDGNPDETIIMCYISYFRDVKYIGHVYRSLKRSLGLSTIQLIPKLSKESSKYKSRRFWRRLEDAIFNKEFPEEVIKEIEEQEMKEEPKEEIKTVVNEEMEQKLNEQPVKEDIVESTEEEEVKEASQENSKEEEPVIEEDVVEEINQKVGDENKEEVVKESEENKEETIENEVEQVNEEPLTQLEDEKTKEETDNISNEKIKEQEVEEGIQKEDTEVIKEKVEENKGNQPVTNEPIEIAAVTTKQQMEQEEKKSEENPSEPVLEESKEEIKEEIKEISNEETKEQEEEIKQEDTEVEVKKEEQPKEEEKEEEKKNTEEISIVGEEEEKETKPTEKEETKPEEEEKEEENKPIEEEKEKEEKLSVTLFEAVKDPSILHKYLTGKKRDFTSSGEIEKLSLEEKIEILEHVDLKEVDEKLNTALHIAVSLNESTSTRILLKAGIDANAVNNEGNTAIHIAVMNNYVKTTVTLSIHKPNVDLKNKEGKTPMEYAITFIDLDDIQKSCGCCYSLIDIGADVSLMYQFNEERHKTFEEKNKDIEVDEYGFKKDTHKVDEKFPTFGLYKKSQNILKKKEKERTVKFKTMIKQMENSSTAIPAKLKSRIRKGVPNGMRGELWKHLIPIKQLKDQNKGMYEKHIQERTSQQTAIQHDKDINRNFRSHRLFWERFGPGQIKLYNVLKAYANYNKDLGYTQGIDSIASMLLIYLEDEEDTFWALVHLMAQPKYLMGDIFLPGFPKLMEDFYIQTQIVQDIMPKLHQKFEDEMLNQMTSAYATTWYMLVFIQDLPWDIVLRIWDIYLNEGSKIIFNCSVGLLRMFEKDLLKMDMEQILKFLKSFETRPIDPELLIKYAVKDKVKRNLILKHQADYKKQKLLDERKRREKKK